MAFVIIPLIFCMRCNFNCLLEYLKSFEINKVIRKAVTPPYIFLVFESKKFNFVMNKFNLFKKNFRVFKLFNKFKKKKRSPIRPKFKCF
jgi:hypothetical protein